MKKQDLKNGIQDLQIKEIQKSIKVLNDHSGTMTDEMGNIKLDMTQMKNDISWIKQFFWIIATATIGSLVANLMNLLK